MPGFDAFNSNMFTLRALTTAIDKAPFQPKRLGKMNLFESKPQSVRSISIEEYNGVLAVIPTAKVGAPATLKKPDKRKVRSFEIPHIPYSHQILAADLAGVREFGTETELQSVGKMVNRHLREMRRDIETTWEWHRMGAITGILLDADGSTVIYNLFDEFGTAEIVHDMDLGTGGTKQHGKGLELKTLIEEALGDDNYDHIRVLCEKTFFRAFIAHTQIQDAYDRWNNGQFLRDDPRFTGFEYPKGVIWEEYRRAVNTVGTLDFIATNTCRAFPVGVPDLFQVNWAPGTKIDTVNTRGRPMYADQLVDPKKRWVDIDVETNPLHLCTRPRVLVKVITST